MTSSRVRGFTALIAAVALTGSAFTPAIATTGEAAQRARKATMRAATSTASSLGTNVATAAVRPRRERVRVDLLVPRRAYLGDRFTVRVKTRNAQKGQRAVVHARTSPSNPWRTAGHGKLNRRGVFQLRQTYTTVGRVQFRAVVKAGKGHKGGRSKARTTRMVVWSTSVGARGVIGTLFYGTNGYWHPDLGEVSGWDLEDLVVAADQEGMDAEYLGPTGRPEATRIVLAARRLVPADGLAPEGFLQQLFVYDPWTGKFERTIDLGNGLDDDDSEPEVAFAGGDGDVIAVTIQRGDVLSPRITHGINVFTGQIVWTLSGTVAAVQRISGDRGVVALTSEIKSSCGTATLVALETGAVLRTVYLGDESGCNSWVYDRGDLLYLGSNPGPYSTVWDASTGVQLTSVFQQSATNYPTELVYDAPGGLLAGKHPDGRFEVTRVDGTSVWSLPAEQAVALQLEIVRLAENTLWLKTTDQVLRVDLATGVARVVAEPTFPIAQIAGNYTYYSDDTLRRDRY